MRVGEVYIFSVTLRLARVNKAWDKNVLLSVVWWQYTLRAAFIGFYFVRLEKFRGLGVVSCGESLEKLVDIYCTSYIINIQLTNFNLFSTGTAILTYFTIFLIDRAKRNLSFDLSSAFGISSVCLTITTIRLVVKFEINVLSTKVERLM